MKLVIDDQLSEREIFNKSKQYGALEKNNFENRNLVIHGENFSALSKLLNSGFKNKIDLVYIDPPFATNGIFRIDANGDTRTVSSANDSIIAYTDNLTGDSFLEFLRERLFLIKELLSPKGSIYLHIDYKIGHYVKLVMDEVFGNENFLNDITRIKSNPKNFGRKAYGDQKDLVLFYAKNKGKNIFNNVTIPYTQAELAEKFKKVDENGRRYNTVPVHAPGESHGDTGMEWKGMLPPKGRHWRTSRENLDKLDEQGLIEWSKTGNPRIKKFADEHKGKKIQDIWYNYKDPAKPLYPTQKNIDMLNMIVKQSSNENSIVLDCFAGSGGTGVAASNLNRRFILVDKSEEAIKIIKKRLSGSLFSDFEMIDLIKEEERVNDLPRENKN